jgi:Sec-independent protein translocase protein TatA
MSGIGWREVVVIIVVALVIVAVVKLRGRAG